MADPHALLTLLDLARRARAAGSREELGFMAVNDSRELCAYRQAALWLGPGGVAALSGVVQPEANAPYVHWLERVCRRLREDGRPAGPIEAGMLDADDAAQWQEWLPAHGLWLPFDTAPAVPAPEAGTASTAQGGGWLLAAEAPWPEDTVALLLEWQDAWRHAWQAFGPRRTWNWERIRHAATHALQPAPGQPWWRQRRVQAAAGVLAVLLFPVRLSVLAPAELVPAHPEVIRAPIDGVIGQFQVQPNQVVKKGQPLFGFDDASLAARLEVASQSLASAEAEYRQAAQQALSDPRSKAQVAILLGKIEEKRADADYLRQQVQRAQVLAPADGVALFDDPSEWAGRPVQTGERIMRIAAPGDMEVEAWVPLADAIPLPAGAPVDLYLSASPLSSLEAKVRYFAHESQARPDGSFAYRLRASLPPGSSKGARVGLKGTAKIQGDRVPLAYWMLRRPLAAVRQAIGL